jgi:hypothetical protein
VDDHEIDPLVRALAAHCVILGDELAALARPLSAPLAPAKLDADLGAVHTAAELQRFYAALTAHTGRASVAAERARLLVRWARANPNR